MTTATETKTALQESIEALGSENFNVCEDSQTSIYLDPEKKIVYTFAASNSMPMSAFHNIDVCFLTVHSGASASSVQSAVEGVVDNLKSILDLYEGTEWDGNNHIGQWRDGVSDEIECLQQKLSDTPIVYYWGAGEWFGPVADELKAEWKAGKNSAQIIDGQYLGNDCDGEVDRDEAIAWLNVMIEDWSAE